MRERESFLAAQARHRASARRWSIALTIVVVAIGLAISLLLGPLAWALLGLLLDLLNFVLPVPDLLGALGRTLGALLDAGGQVDPLGLAGFVGFAMLPGMLVLLAAWHRLGRIFAARHPDVLRQALGLREPLGGDLEESQLRNLVAEMAIASGRPPPRLHMIDSTACNLGIVGDGADAAVIITRGLLDQLDRAQTQALVGQAIAALGDGDGLLAERLLRLNAVTGLLVLLSQAPMNAAARAALRPLFRLRRRDAAAELNALRHALGDPLALPDNAADSTRMTWRDWARMPLTGSMMIGVVIVPAGVLALFSPLCSLLWRRRRLLADAMAVQFTRDPQALADAYAALSRHWSAPGLRAPWLGDLFLLDAGSSSSFRVLSPYPAPATRMKRLNAMGAQVAMPVGRTIPLWIWLAGIPLGALLVVLFGALIYLGVFVSLAANGFFLALPTALLHVLLRHLAGSY